MEFRIFTAHMIMSLRSTYQNHISENHKVAIHKEQGDHDGPISYISHPSKQGPVVQSVISLTSSLRAISLTILADSIYNFLKFFAEKM